jgi:hypothetical protein
MLFKDYLLHKSPHSVPFMIINLIAPEIAALMAQDPNEARKGGFQSLLVKLQNKYDPATRTINLSEDDLEKIQRYAFDYRAGGWQTLLKTIFSRSLGDRLGRGDS